MSKKTIVLADGSYTIRRIVELSFSEIENVDVASFENGQGLKEKLLSMRPDVVIADVKLPDVNGYEICRFVNSSDALRATRVFLLKGSFEPIDNEQLKNLRYQDIVTKPFDSNMLVATVMKALEAAPAAAPGAAAEEEVPGTMPEDFPEIEAGESGGEDISFSDIREELHHPAGAGRVVTPRPMEREEVQPSEEITQGTQPVKDVLAPEVEESFENPFAEEPLVGTGKPAPAVTEVPVMRDLPRTEFVKPKPEPEPELETEESFGIGDKFPEFTSEEDTSESARRSVLDVAAFPEKEEEFPGEISVGSGDEAAVASDSFQLEGSGGRLEDFSRPASGARGDLYFGEPPQKEFLQESHDTYRSRTEPVVETGTATPPLEHEISDFFAPPPPPAPAAPRSATPPPDLSLKEKSELVGQVEDRLTLAIKELLWEIVPPLAEKIIKEEIDRIKAELKGSEA